MDIDNFSHIFGDISINTNITMDQNTNKNNNAVNNTINDQTIDDLINQFSTTTISAVSISKMQTVLAQLIESLSKQKTIMENFEKNKNTALQEYNISCLMNDTQKRKSEFFTNYKYATSKYNLKNQNYVKTENRINALKEKLAYYAIKTC